MPVAQSTRLLSALRAELVTAGLVRRPSDAGALPPLFIEPIDGPPAPGEREAPETDGTLVVTARLSSELGEGPGDSWRRRIVVDLVYRSTGTAGIIAGRALDEAIRERLVHGADYGMGVLLDEAGSPVRVLQFTVFGGIGPVAQEGGVRTELAKYLAEVETG